MDLLVGQRESREEKKSIMGKILVIKCSDIRYHDGTVDFCRDRYFARFSDVTFPGGIFQFLHGNCDLFIENANMLNEEFGIEELKIFSHEYCKAYINYSKFKKLTSEQINEQIQSDLRLIKTKGIGNFLPKQIECFYAFKHPVTGKQLHSKIS